MPAAFRRSPSTTGSWCSALPLRVGPGAAPERRDGVDGVGGKRGAGKAELQ